jgi:hypothetical protein
MLSRQNNDWHTRSFSELVGEIDLSFFSVACDWKYEATLRKPQRVSDGMFMFGVICDPSDILCAGSERKNNSLLLNVYVH